MESYQDFSDQDSSLNEPRTEGARIRSLLRMPQNSNTEDVLTAIQVLQYHNDRMTSVWEALTELLYLGPDTPPSDVLTTMALYVKEAQFLKEQEQRHLFIIQKLQNDRREILKRFHLNKPKVASASKIRCRAQFPRQTTADVDELDIIEDENESIFDDYEARQKQLQAEMKSNTNNVNVNSPLWKHLDEVNGTKPPRNRTLPQRTDSASDDLADSLPGNGPRQHVQGYIISKANHKSKMPTDIRQNVTVGTKESTTHKPDTADTCRYSVSVAGSQHTRKSKLARCIHLSRQDEVSKVEKAFIICSEVHIPEKGGCYNIPDLGLTISVPGGALPEGSISEKIIIGLLWDETGPVADRLMPVGPILTIRPSGLPFRKPIVVSLHHNLTAMSPTDDSRRLIQGTNLILMQQTGLRADEKWQPVATDPEDPYFTPLGFIAANNTVMFIRNAGKYALVPSQKSTLFVPGSLLVLVFAGYLKTESESELKLDIFCLEDNQANRKLCEVMKEVLKHEVTPRHLVGTHHMSLSGQLSLTVKLEDLIGGWTIKGNKTQTIDAGRLGQGHTPVVSFTLKHNASQLRCLLVKLTLKGDCDVHQQGHKDILKESVPLSIDLDQLEKSGNDQLPSGLITSSVTSLTSSKSSTNQIGFLSKGGGTFITDSNGDRAGQRPSKHLPSDKVSSSSLIRFRVTAVKNQHSWIPDWVKGDLVKEVKGEMYSVDKWNKLLKGMQMEYLDEILQQSVDPVLDLFSYCEVTGIDVQKVCDVLASAGFEDSAKVLSSYLNQMSKK